MHISKINIVNFRNHIEAEFTLKNGVNCFVGNNGSGKTNVLDAVYYLSMCRSYLNAIDKQNIRFNEQFFVLQAEWWKGETCNNLYCGVKLGGKKVFKRNKKEYERLADHIGHFPVVMISPYDADLISEGSEVRRKWLDGIIAQFDRPFLDDLQRYNKVLDQRNALLKHQYENGLFDRESLEIWDAQLILYGNSIYGKRKAFIENFIPIFQKYYTFISQGKESVSLNYESQLHSVQFFDLLQQALPKDSRVQYTTVGTHKDDFAFLINEMPIKKYGSQGQQKSFLIALRLAQFECLKEFLGVTPILLLDDIFDKLDNQRVAQLMDLVSKNTFEQVLVTDTDEKRVRDIFETIAVEPNLLLFESVNHE